MSIFLMSFRPGKSIVTLQRRRLQSLNYRGIQSLSSWSSSSSSSSSLCTSSRICVPVGMRNRNVKNNVCHNQNSQQRFLTFYNNQNTTTTNPIMIGNPSYIVFGEECAFSVKAILPEFRSTQSNGEGMIVLDSNKRGKLLFEWTPLKKSSDSSSFKKYRWESTTRFALSAEEAGSILARLDRGDTSIEFTRRMGNTNTNTEYTNNFQNTTGKNLTKLLCIEPIVMEMDMKSEMESESEEQSNSGGTSTGISTSSVKKNDGISLLIDYIDSDLGGLGQIPHPPSDQENGVLGPFKINLMIGEYYVLRSIIEQSIPKLIGWSTMFDPNNEQALMKSVRGRNSGSGNYSNNYNNNNNNRGGGGGSGSGSGSVGASTPHDYFDD